MEMRTIEDKNVSLLGFGCMRLPTAKGKIDYEQTEKMVDYAVKNGVNYFDTAYPYHGGESEIVIGRILKSYPRDTYYIADKFPIWLVKTADDIERIFEEQLIKLGVDYIDFYLMHSMERSSMKTFEDLKIYDFFKRQKELGRIKNLGFSFHDVPKTLQEIVDNYEWDFAQIQMNYLDWSYMEAETLYSILEDKNIPIVVMEPIRGGFLADPSPEAAKIAGKLERKPSLAVLALKWAANYPSVKVILSGMSDMTQLEENVSVFSDYIPITNREITAIDEILHIIEGNKTIPCTGCRYCMDCDFGVDIPELFKIYNHYLVVKDDFRTGIQYSKYFDDDRKPENCITCGACSDKCPQHIDIPNQLEIVKKTLNLLCNK